MVLGGVFEMSEMKLEIKDDANFEKAMAAYWKMRGYSDLEKVRAALEAYVPNIERTIAEAVAAERERCAKVCEAAAPKCDYSILGNVGDALNHAAEAIRSAAK